MVGQQQGECQHLELQIRTKQFYWVETAICTQSFNMC